MSDEEIVKRIAEKVMGWDLDDSQYSDHRKDGDTWLTSCGLLFKVGRKRGNTTSWVLFNPLTSISDAWMMEAEIEKKPIHIRLKYVTAIYNQIAGSQEIIGTLRIHWGMLHATPRQRGLAALSALGEE